MNTILSPTNNIQKYHGPTGDPYIFYWSYDLGPFTHLILLKVSSPSPEMQQCDKTFLQSNTDQCDYGFLYSNTDQCDYGYEPPKPSQCKTFMNEITALWRQQLTLDTSSHI